MWGVTISFTAYNAVIYERPSKFATLERCLYACIYTHAKGIFILGRSLQRTKGDISDPMKNKYS